MIHLECGDLIPFWISAGDWIVETGVNVEQQCSENPKLRQGGARHKMSAFPQRNGAEQSAPVLSGEAAAACSRERQLMENSFQSIG